MITSPEHRESNQSDSRSSRPPTGQRTATIAVLVIVGIALGLGAYAMYGPSPRVPQGILTATADEHREGGYRQEGSISDGAVVSATATKLESNRNVSTSTVTGSSGGDRMFDRTLAIYNFDDDLLMQRLGLTLFEQLRDSQRFQQIRYLPAGEHLPDGERLPDVFVTLDKKSWKEKGLPGARQFEGVLVVNACDRFRRSSHSYRGTLTPPQLQYRWRARIDYTAKQTGIETSGAQYQAVSRDLAAEIVEQFTKQLDDFSANYGTVEELPEQFYPEYVEPPVFSFVEELNAKKLVDGSQFMKQTVAIWQTPDERTPREVIAAVGRSLSDAGWKVPEIDNERQYLRVQNGSQVVVAFRKNDGLGSFDDDVDTPTRMFVVYTASMSEDEIGAAVGAMFDDDVDESTLLMFQNAWYLHRADVEQYFSEHTPQVADSWLQLARFRKKSQPDKARNALLRANALRRIVDQTAPDSSMKKLGEELGIEELPQQISHEMIKSLGLQELHEPGEIKLTVRDNQRVVIWLGDDGEEQTYLLLKPIRKPGAKPEQTLNVQLLKLRDGGWSRSEQTSGDLTEPKRPVHIQHLSSGQLVQIFSEPNDAGQSYRLKIKRSESRNE